MEDLYFFMIVLKAERYTHGVRLFGYSRETYHRIEGFLKRLELREPKKLPHGRMTMELKKKYYGVFEDLSEIYIHVNSFVPLLDYLETKGIPRNNVEIKEIPVPTPLPAEFEVFEKYVLRDYQELIHEDVTKKPHHSARIDLQTGKGKTLISLYSAKTLGHRLLVMLPPKYFGLWEEALDNTYKDIQMRYVRVSGSPDLKVLIDKVQAGELTDVDVFLVSNITYRNYIEAFENNNGVIEQLGYNVIPTKFHELLGIGLQINDEIQEDPGLLFRIDMYSNVAKQIYLSATPFTGNDYVTKMIDVMLPEPTKVRLPKIDSYIDCVGVLYNDIGIRPKDYLTPFKNTYNHARYETVMRDRPKRLKQYFEMIDRLVEGLYSKDRLPGQKLLILCSTVAFIELMVEHLTKRFPDLGVYGYTSGSSYEKLLASDITVSTIKSAGTGVDIPNLREVLLCQATDSKKDSIQILGRLRPLRDFKDVTPRLTYLCCENIPHHCRYARNKEKHLEGRTKSMVMRRIRM